MKASLPVSKVAQLYNVSVPKLREMIERVRKHYKLNLLYQNSDRVIFKSDLDKLFDDETGLGNPLPDSGNKTDYLK